MHWAKLVVLAAALLTAGWWAFDGAHALLTGDLVTPESGRFEGQYGPWSKVVSALGVNPRSTLMHAAFLILGVVWLAILTAWMFGVRGAWWAVLGFAFFSLWYLPFGTVLGLVQIALLIAFRSKLS